jgi:hypothetical protein
VQRHSNSHEMPPRGGLCSGVLAQNEVVQDEAILLMTAGGTAESTLNTLCGRNQVGGLQYHRPVFGSCLMRTLPGGPLYLWQSTQPELPAAGAFLEEEFEPPHAGVPNTTPAIIKVAMIGAEFMCPPSVFL